ncbi:MAG: ferritin-like domain-containing protein [Lautropia sp.]
MADIKTLDDLFVHELSDIYSAEKQLTRALPKLARAAADQQLAAGFTRHLEETQGQVERIDEIVELVGIRLKRMKCHAMEGLVEEGNEVVEMIGKGLLRDIALIGGARRVEHYEIAGYTTLIMLAEKLGHRQAIALLRETLAEETATDEKLGKLAQAMKMEAATAKG